jgi:hypothetical protein
MRSWFSRFLAAVLCAVCLIPAPTSAYYYRGHYYRYRYHGHYYRYYNRGHYYQYYYQGRYYGQRVWVVGSNGRPGYYRYWWSCELIEALRSTDQLWCRFAEGDLIAHFLDSRSKSLDLLLHLRNLAWLFYLAMQIALSKPAPHLVANP